jgi:hypothetical protein
MEGNKTMTPNDIKVGHYYTHRSTGDIYLGCGSRTMWQNTFTTSNANFSDKKLVIVKSDGDFLGQFMQEPENCMGGFWENVEEINLETTSAVAFYDN